MLRFEREWGYELVEKHDGIGFGSLCKISRINDARIGTLLRYLATEGKLNRSDGIGQYAYHTTREKAEAAVIRPRDAYVMPKDDVVASCKACSAVYKFDQLLKGIAIRS